MDIFQVSRKIVPLFNIKYLLVVYRTIRLLATRGFVPQEALQLGILELNFPQNELNKFTSKREMAKIQKALNPMAWEPLTEDKGIFYMYCATLGIPIPQLYAIFFKHNAGYTAKGSVLRTPEDWQEFIDNELPSEFIIKPSGGAYGSGVKCFLRVGEDAFVDAASEKKYTAKDIYNHMYSSPGKNNSFIIQERLRNHPELIRLSNAEGLQTFRVWTLVDKNGQGRILLVRLKVIVGQHLTDNIEHGISGNLCAGVNLDRGTLKPAVKYTPNSSGIITVPCHPETGVCFEEFPVPFWEDVCMIVKKTSLKFLPLRIIGWDVAVTPKGPYIIEGNFWADPPNEQKSMDLITSAVREN